MREAEAVLMAQPFPSNRTFSPASSLSTTTSSFMESPQVGFSWAMAWGMWSRGVLPRGAAVVVHDDFLVQLVECAHA